MSLSIQSLHFSRVFKFAVNLVFSVNSLSKIGYKLKITQTKLTLTLKCKNQNDILVQKVTSLSKCYRSKFYRIYIYNNGNPC